MFDTVTIDRPETVSDSRSAVAQTPLLRLRPRPQLRLGELNQDHLSVIALCDGDWPPIVIRREDNTIIDGHYRYLAARQLGHTHIACVYFDGGDEAVFLEALRRNRSHGLPLSLQERQRAARRLLESHPDWSHRRIAELCSLAPGTVARLRATAPPNRATQEPEPTRLGKDGRRRPSNPSAARDRILRALEAQPDRSLREIARITGSSPATVKATRTKLAALNGPSSPLPVPHQTTPAGQAIPAPVRWTPDGALLSTIAGQGFASWFEQTNIDNQSSHYLPDVPISRIYEIADEARRRATAWLTFASLLENRTKPPHPSS
jgi:hypothetical protein